MLAGLAVGCGGTSTNGPDQTYVQDFASSQLRLRLDASMTADQFRCVEDGDSLHWRCTTDVRDEGPDPFKADDTVFPVTASVTCDKQKACIYEQAR